MSNGRYYRKKTLTLAVQWHRRGDCPAWAKDAVVETDHGFEIATREGVLKGVSGDWIAQGPAGEVYPIGADIFTMTYEPA